MYPSTEGSGDTVRMHRLVSWADPEGEGYKMEHYKWLYVSLEIRYGASLRSNWTLLILLLLEGGPYGPL